MKETEHLPPSPLQRPGAGGGPARGRAGPAAAAPGPGRGASEKFRRVLKGRRRRRRRRRGLAARTATRRRGRGRGRVAVLMTKRRRRINGRRRTGRRVSENDDDCESETRGPSRRRRRRRRRHVRCERRGRCGRRPRRRWRQRRRWRATGGGIGRAVLSPGDVEASAGRWGGGRRQARAGIGQAGRPGCPRRRLQTTRTAGPGARRRQHRRWQENSLIGLGCKWERVNEKETARKPAREKRRADTEGDWPAVTPGVPACPSLGNTVLT